MTLTTLCYVRRGDAVLMLRRAKSPNLGQVTAPGGKLRPGEAPQAGAVRELAEETGLHVAAPALRAVITQTADDPNEHWMLFIFTAAAPPGAVVPASCPEGRLFWCPIAELLDGVHDIPPADRLFTRWLFGPAPGLVRAAFHHAPDLRVERHARYS